MSLYSNGEVILVLADCNSPGSIMEEVYRREDKHYIYCEGDSRIFDKAFCFPAHYREELVKILTERAALKKAYDDSMAGIYQLCNRKSREAQQ